MSYYLTLSRQIAEKRNSVQHYKEFVGDLSEGMKSAEVVLKPEGVRSVTNDKKFKYVKMWTFAKYVLTNNRT